MKGLFKNDNVTISVGVDVITHNPVLYVERCGETLSIKEGVWLRDSIVDACANANVSKIYVVTTGGFSLSEDYGETWSHKKLANPDLSGGTPLRRISVDELGEVLCIATYSNVIISVNSGKLWNTTHFSENQLKLPIKEILVSVFGETVGVTSTGNVTVTLPTRTWVDIKKNNPQAEFSNYQWPTRIDQALFIEDKEVSPAYIFSNDTEMWNPNLPEIGFSTSTLSTVTKYSNYTTDIVKKVDVPKNTTELDGEVSDKYVKKMFSLMVGEENLSTAVIEEGNSLYSEACIKEIMRQLNEVNHKLYDEGLSIFRPLPDPYVTTIGFGFSREDWKVERTPCRPLNSTSYPEYEKFRERIWSRAVVKGMDSTARMSWSSLNYADLSKNKIKQEDGDMLSKQETENFREVGDLLDLSQEVLDLNQLYSSENFKHYEISSLEEVRDFVGDTIKRDEDIAYLKSELNKQDGFEGVSSDSKDNVSLSEVGGLVSTLESIVVKYGMWMSGEDKKLVGDQQDFLQNILDSSDVEDKKEE